MPDFNPQLAIALLRSNAQSFGPTALEQEAYIKEAEARLGGRSSEDQREAVKIAVDTSKMFLTIASGVLVATFVWMQFANNKGVLWLSQGMLPFYAAAALLVLSMVCGFVAIAKIFRRAEGREAVNDPAWSTRPVKGLLNGQSWSGMGAFAALFVGAVCLGPGVASPKPSVSLTIPGQAGSLPAGGSLTIEGVWTELRFKTTAQQEIKLPQQTLPVTVTCQ
jgi:hypothetical protein